MPGPWKASASAIKAWRSRVGLSDCVPEVTEGRSIACNSAMPLDDKRCTMSDSVAQLAGARVAVHALAYAIRGVEVGFCSGAYGTAFDGLFERSAIHHGHGFADLETELCIKR